MIEYKVTKLMFLLSILELDSFLGLCFTLRSNVILGWPFKSPKYFFFLPWKYFILKASVQSAGAKNKEQYIIYIWKESMPIMREIVGPYVHSSMKYKILKKKSIVN